MDKKTGESIALGIGILALGIAAIGSTYFIIKKVQKLDDTATSSITNNSSQVSGSTSGNVSGSISSTASSSSTSQGNSNITYVPVLSGNKSRIDWVMNDSDTTFPEDSFIVSISNLPTNATTKDRELTIYCDDDALDQWIQIYQVKDGSEVTLTSPYTFHSGETVRVRQKKKAPIIGGYKIPLWILSPSYDLDAVHWNVDIYMTTND